MVSGIFLALGIGLLSVVSPFLGLIFLLGWGGRYIATKPTQRYVFISVLCLTVITSGIALFNRDYLYQLTDSFIGVLFLFLLMLYFLYRVGAGESVMLKLIVVNIVYGAIRQFFFKTSLLAAYDKAIQMNQETINTISSHSPEISPLVLSSIHMGRSLVESYGVAMWSISMTLAIYIGWRVMFRGTIVQARMRFLRWPHWTVIGLIAGLAMVLYAPLRIAGNNLILCLIPIFMIQGISVLAYNWGNYFEKTPVLKALLIISFIINYPLMILLALLGLFDQWFDFRKIVYREKSNENHPD